MQEWSQTVLIAIGLLISAFVVTCMVFYVGKGRELNEQLSRQGANKELMQEYREYNGYNNHTVYAQDVVSLVLQKRGSVAVRVLVGTNLKAYWCDNEDIEAALSDLPEGAWLFEGAKKQNDYTATKVTDQLDVNKVYFGSLTYGLNGEVLGVTFRQGTTNDAGEFIPD